MSKISEVVFEYDRALDRCNIEELLALLEQEPRFGRLSTWAAPFWAALWAIRVSRSVGVVNAAERGFSYPHSVVDAVRLRLPPGAPGLPPNIRILLALARCALPTYNTNMMWQRVFDERVMNIFRMIAAQMQDGEYSEGTHYANIIAQEARTVLGDPAPAGVERLGWYLDRLIYKPLGGGMGLTFSVGDAWPGEAAKPLGYDQLGQQATLGGWKITSLGHGSSHWLHGHQDAGSILLAYNGREVLLDPGITEFSDRIPRWRRWASWEWHNTCRLWGKRRRTVKTEITRLKYSTDVVQNDDGYSRTVVLYPDHVELDVISSKWEPWTYIEPEGVHTYPHTQAGSVAHETVEVAAGYRQRRKATRWRFYGSHSLMLYPPEG